MLRGQTIFWASTECLLGFFFSLVILPQSAYSYTSITTQLTALLCTVKDTQKGLHFPAFLLDPANMQGKHFFKLIILYQQKLTDHVWNTLLCL